MVRKLIVGVTGTHSTGKTTFCNELQQKLKTHDIAVAMVPSFGKLAVQLNIPVLHEHTYDSTIWFINKTIEAQAHTSNNSTVVLVDRPVIDAFAYWRAAIDHRRVPMCEVELAKLRDVVEQQIPIYNYLVATEIDQTIPIAPNRNNDQIFRKNVDKHLKDTLQNLKIHHHILSTSNRSSVLNGLTEGILNDLGKL